LWLKWWSIASYLPRKARLKDKRTKVDKAWKIGGNLKVYAKILVWSYFSISKFLVLLVF
jgi:hypothetical protein